MHVRRGDDDPSGRAQVLRFVNHSGYKIINTAGADENHPLPASVRAGWRSFAVEMEDSEFCYSPLGQSEGDSDRYVAAILFGCIPVMLTETDYQHGPVKISLPLYEHPELNWSSFSVGISSRDLRRLDEILDAITPKERLRMRQKMNVIWHRLLYSRMYGSYLGEPDVHTTDDAFESLIDVLRGRVQAMDSGASSIVARR